MQRRVTENSAEGAVGSLKDGDDSRSFILKGNLQLYCLDFFSSGCRGTTIGGSGARLQAKGHCSVRRLRIDAQWQSEGMNRKSKNRATSFISRQRGHFVLLLEGS